MTFVDLPRSRMQKLPEDHLEYRTVQKTTHILRYGGFYEVELGGGFYYPFCFDALKGKYYSLGSTAPLILTERIKIEIKIFEKATI